MSGYIDSKTPRGPQRWLRALNNWEANPDSPAAKLFAGRLALARQVQSQYGDDWNSRAFLKNTYRDRDKWVVDFYTCSKFCASMQVQLEFSEVFKEADAEIHDALIVDYRDGNEKSECRKVEMRWPTKEARCQTCGRGINGPAKSLNTNTIPLFLWPEEWQQGWQNDALETEEPPEHDVYSEPNAEPYQTVFVDADGRVIDDFDQVRVVTLTPREADLFWSTDKLARKSFAQTHGTTVAHHYG